MKIVSTLVLLLVLTIARTQTNSVDLKFDSAQSRPSPIADSTGIGKPDGKQVSKEIGVTGGTITSDDGRVELIFPAGSLKSSTIITIQPSTNLAPNGVGKSYQFEPSGIQFLKPVKIIFSYTDDEAEVCPPEWMSLGIQNDKGKWSFVDYEEADTISKKLIGFIHHFSSATNVNQIQLRPDRMKIPVTDSVMIEVVDISEVDTSSTTVSGFLSATVNKREPVLWYANQVQNGDNVNGRIRVTTAPVGKARILLGQYFAPKLLPKQNAVAIWAEIYRRTKKGKELRKRIKTYIEVYDKYHVSVIKESTVRGGLGSILLDSANFNVYVYAHSFEVMNIKNYAPIVIKEGRRMSFREKLTVGDALGTVHVTEGIKNGSLSKDYPPEVFFEFTSMEILVCKFQHGSRGIWTDPEPYFEMSVPQEINFIANGQEQRINVTDGGEVNYKLVVRPIRGRE